MTKYDVIVEGRNFSSQINSKQSHVGFFVTVNIDGIENIQSKVFDKLKEMLSKYNKNQSSPLLISGKSYIRINHVFDVEEVENSEGFSIYKMNFIDYYFAAFQYYIFRLLTKLNILIQLRAPVKMRARIDQS
jgi:hypothetical protein